MSRLVALHPALLGLALALLLAGGCGQNEGGRCQISSDCASGLVCSDSSGNGVCRPSGAVTSGGSDAGSAKDEAQDQAPFAGPEAGPEVGPDVVEPIEVEPAPAPLDAERVDSDGVDATEIDLL